MAKKVILRKPKFKMTIDEMIEFNDDCEQATIGLGHKSNFVIEDRVIFRKEISAKKLVKHWIKVLGSHGTVDNDNLSLDAVTWISEYKNYRDKKRAWKVLQKEQRLDEVERCRKENARKGPYLA